jgi:hypothetical protein
VHGQSEVNDSIARAIFGGSHSHVGEFVVKFLEMNATDDSRNLEWVIGTARRLVEIICEGREDYLDLRDRLLSLLSALGRMKTVQFTRNKRKNAPTRRFNSIISHRFNLTVMRASRPIDW